MENTRRRRSYHRNTTRRRASQPQKTSSDSFKEKILMQCIISGVIFLFVLIINMLDTEFTNNLKQTLKAAIVSTTTVDDLKASADGTTSYFSVVEETVKTIFGYEKEPETSSDDLSLESQSGQTEASEADDNDFRIDEDILEMMNETPKKQ